MGEKIMVKPRPAMIVREDLGPFVAGSWDSKDHSWVVSYIYKLVDAFVWVLEHGGFGQEADSMKGKSVELVVTVKEKGFASRYRVTADWSKKYQKNLVQVFKVKVRK